MDIRPEREADWAGIRRVNELAFGRPAEADLVDALRAAGAVITSLVAEEDGAVVGHILFSPATLASHSHEGQNTTPTASNDAPNGATAGPSGEPMTIAALGPMAVLPAQQGQGIGSQLVRAGLEACRAAGYRLVIVLGHADYYPRFGFRPSAPFGIRWERAVPEEVFMVAELRPGALAGAEGVVRYRAEFDLV